MSEKSPFYFPAWRYRLMYLFIAVVGTGFIIGLLKQFNHWLFK